jgi:cytoplasmic iron level regulating protein YaaA (DUF328/UPF0246 family)
MGGVLILLPPSESKHPPVRGASLDLGSLSFPALTPLRRKALEALQHLCSTDPTGAIEALGLGPTQFDLVVQNIELDSAPTAAASRIYTGVLYTALDHPTLTGRDLRRANKRIAVVSALFGLVRASDRIPAYRLSGGSRLPGFPALPRYWRDAVSAQVAGHRGLVVDMLSSPYASFVSLPHDAITVKVWQPGPAGQRTAASHFNKATKGHLARALATAEEISRPADLLAEVRRAGFEADLDGRRLDVMRVE